MSKEVSTISPEGLEVANAYLSLGSIDLVSDQLGIERDHVVQYLSKREVKRYIDTVYLDLGYRNRANIANLLDEIIAQKLEDARESGVYSIA